MFRRWVFTAMLLAGCASGAWAQVPGVITGWEPLPDSLMRAWRLPPDEVRRLQVIQEDYGIERSEVWNTPGLAGEEKAARIAKLGEARAAEIKGVLGTAQYERWLQWVRASSSLREPSR